MVAVLADHRSEPVPDPTIAVPSPPRVEPAVHRVAEPSVGPVPVLAGLVTCCVALLLVLGGTSASGATGPRRSLPPVVVEPGDTYWSLATSLGAGGDVREGVDALVAANNGRPLHPGDVLVLPATGVLGG